MNKTQTERGGEMEWGREEGKEGRKQKERGLVRFSELAEHNLSSGEAGVQWGEGGLQVN